MSKAFWTCIAVKLMSAGISAGYSLAGLLNSGGDRFASYAASRTVALLISALVRVWARSRTAHRYEHHTITTGALANERLRPKGHLRSRSSMRQRSSGS
jgi:hypothetical protein